MAIDGLAGEATTPVIGATRRTKRQPQKQVTTAQRLGSLVKSARDLMRKDKGLNGDLDRLPMLTWVMFLKFMDDLEQEREAFAESGYTPIIDAPYRWRDWATNDTGPTGDDLIAFLSNQQAIRPDGSEGMGLFPYLRTLAGSDVPQRNVIGNLFRAFQNRMMDGYLLRQVVNLVDGIHFDSADEIHTLGNLYESMLKEMRDAAGDSGEFYTPRPVVRLMVEVNDPRLGEVVFDPACGTGGFLVETFTYLEKQCQTVADRTILQERSIIGGEAKGLPYLLAQMNLLLHGVESPRVTLDNSLKVVIGQIGDADRVDVILTNPPFGGEEEPSIQSNFPVGYRTSETALLFLQLIMRKLRRGERSGERPGRAAVVVPNGTLFADGVAAKTKEQLLTEFHLHTIVRLPNGIFAPYTSIPTNLLFFDRSGPSTDIWFYEQPLPAGKKNYTKTSPIQFEEFAPLIAWWKQREETDRAWKVDFKAKIDGARAEAEPHWQAARQNEEKAREYSAVARALSDRIAELQRRMSDRSTSSAEKATILAEMQGLRQEQSAATAAESDCEQAARAEQAAGDAIYWPIFNLDIKNPISTDDFTHLPPEQLVEDIIAKERRILELMEEIRSALGDGGVK